jgi:hypothetical protein
VLSNQYRTLLGKLTAMRASLGEKLREDAVSLHLRSAFCPISPKVIVPLM